MTSRMSYVELIDKITGKGYKNLYELFQSVASVITVIR